MNGSGAIGILLFVAVSAMVLVMQRNTSEELTSAVSAHVAAQATAMEPLPETVEAEAPPDQPAPFTQEIVNDRGKWVSAADVAYLLRPDRFGLSRRVVITTPVDPASLLKPGEEMPEGDMRRLMIEARAARLADAVCERMLDSVAERCGVTKYTIGGFRIEGDDVGTARAALFQGMATVTTTAVFVPKANVGTFPDTSTLMLSDRRFELDDWQVPGPWPAATEPKLTELLVAADAACENIREVHGNCVVREVHAEFGRDLGELRRWFELAWFAPVYDDPAGATVAQ